MIDLYSKAFAKNIYVGLEDFSEDERGLVGNPGPEGLTTFELEPQEYALISLVCNLIAFIASSKTQELSKRWYNTRIRMNSIFVAPRSRD